jgi:hypothetical protein
MAVRHVTKFDPVADAGRRAYPACCFAVHDDNHNLPAPQHQQYLHLAELADICLLNNYGSSAANRYGQIAQGSISSYHRQAVDWPSASFYFFSQSSTPPSQAI